MKHYLFGKTFRSLYDKAVEQYEQGQRGAFTFFNDEEINWLSSNGLSAQNLYDYAEDQCNGGEPGFETALAIESIRRDYFLNVQNGERSGRILDEDSLPSKTEAVANIEWLPRIIPKAKAKLRGELPESLMYCCGGDRRFFKTHDINPAEFLAIIWRHEEDEDAIIHWVAQRSASRQ